MAALVSIPDADFLRVCSGIAYYHNYYKFFGPLGVTGEFTPPTGFGLLPGSPDIITYAQERVISWIKKQVVAAEVEINARQKREELEIAVTAIDVTKTDVQPIRDFEGVPKR